MLDKLRAAWAFVKADLADTYQRSKMILLAIGAAILYLEWQNLKEALLVYFGKKQIQNANKQDASLADTENSDSAKADALQKQANQLPSQEKPVTADWYKKK